MSISIHDFRSTVQKGFQRPDKYKILFPLPTFMQKSIFRGEFLTTARALPFYSDSVDLVGVGMQTLPITRYGYGAAHEYVYGATFQNIMITFYNDAKNNNLFFFQQWLSLCNNFDMSGTIQGSDELGVAAYESYYRDDYVVDANITLLTQTGVEAKTWTMRNCFPKAIVESKLAWSIVNDVHRITVIFSYVDWFQNPQHQDTVPTTGSVNIPGGVPAPVTGPTGTFA